MTTGINMNKAPLITLEDITVRLRDKVYLKNTSWQIDKGQNWAIIGPNGAGKTTLAKALFGGVPVVKGQVRHRFSTDELRPIYDAIGYVAPEQQRGIMAKEKLLLDSRDYSGNIDEVTTVADIILGRAYRPDIENSGDRHCLDKVAHRLEIESILDSSILSISSGEMTKTLIARALLKEPRLLILDEPYDGLDHESRSSLKQMLERLIADQIQLVLITHRLDEIMSNLSHVLMLKNGSVFASGKHTEVLRPDILKELYALGTSSWVQPMYLPDSYSKGTTSSSKHHINNRENTDSILIQMKDTTVRYKGSTILDRINWMVKHRQNWMISGPNGAGKTTLLKLILGENLQAYANDITLFGRQKGSGESIWEIKKNIGFISSDLLSRYHMHVSVFDVVCSGFFDSIGLYRLCTDEQRDIARSWIETLGITALADEKFGQISHGQCQLVLIARIMVKSPLLLLLDEPCDGLDIANREKLLQLLNIIGDRSNTNLIYVTHHPSETFPSITHMMHLDGGKIVGIYQA